MRPTAFAVTTALCLSLAPAIAVGSTIQGIQITGTTTGCFGDGCAAFAGHANSGAFAFEGLTFDVTTDESGWATFSLGVLSRGNAFLSDTLPFTLQVEFTAPGDTTSIQYAGTLLVAVSASGAGPVWVDFDNGFLESGFLGGSLSFGVLDVGTSGTGRDGINKNGSEHLMGSIRFAPVTASSGQTAATNPAANQGPAPQQISEPASLLLLGIGLLGVGIHARRTRRGGATGGSQAGG